MGGMELDMGGMGRTGANRATLATEGGTFHPLAEMGRSSVIAEDGISTTLLPHLHELLLFSIPSFATLFQLDTFTLSSPGLGTPTAPSRPRPPSR